jgi:hypothetical protein
MPTWLSPSLVLQGPHHLVQILSIRLAQKLVYGSESAYTAMLYRALPKLGFDCNEDYLEFRTRAEATLEDSYQ